MESILSKESGSSFSAPKRQRSVQADIQDAVSKRMKDFHNEKEFGHNVVAASLVINGKMRSSDLFSRSKLMIFWKGQILHRFLILPLVKPSVILVLIQTAT
jgi:hypothetical protein